VAGIGILFYCVTTITVRPTHRNSRFFRWLLACSNQKNRWFAGNTTATNKNSPYDCVAV